jgi:hypothetical protein
VLDLYKSGKGSDNEGLRSDSKRSKVKEEGEFSFRPNPRTFLARTATFPFANTHCKNLRLKWFREISFMIRVPVPLMRAPGSNSTAAFSIWSAGTITSGAIPTVASIWRSDH